MVAVNLLNQLGYTANCFDLPTLFAGDNNIINYEDEDASGKPATYKQSAVLNSFSLIWCHRLVAMSYHYIA